jgi:hypothetical protein
MFSSTPWPFGLKVFAARVGAMLEADGPVTVMLPTASGP